MPDKHEANAREAPLAGVEGERPAEPHGDPGGEGGQGDRRNGGVGRKADCTGAGPRSAGGCGEIDFSRDEPPRKASPPVRKVSAQTPPRLEPKTTMAAQVPSLEAMFWRSVFDVSSTHATLRR